MSKRTMIEIVACVAIAVAVIVLLRAGRSGGDTAVKVVSDTVTRTDTLRITSLMPIRSYRVRTDTAYLHTTDTIRHTDSVRVEVPITQHTYNDSAYTAYVSGYHARLDSISLYRKTITISNTVTRYKVKRWSVGVQVGMGYGGKATPYVGIGIGYSLFSF